MSDLVKIDASELDALAKRLGLSADQIARVQYRAINRIADKAFTRSRREIVSTLSLTDRYVSDRMTLTKATEDRPFAVVSARRRPTTLATYGARQLVAAAKRAKGDARRSIPAGRKQAGISVLVSRSAGRKKMAGAFLIPLRAGKVDGGNGMGVFIREGGLPVATKALSQTGTIVGKHRWRRGGQLRHLYGPSVDQAFRWAREVVVPELKTELEAEMTRLAVLEFKKAIR